MRKSKMKVLRKFPNAVICQGTLGYWVRNNTCGYGLDAISRTFHSSRADAWRDASANMKTVPVRVYA